LHGFLAWGLTVLVGAWLGTSMVSSLASGLFSAGKAAAHAGGAAISAAGAAGSGMVKSFGIDADEVLGGVNQRLQMEGKPPVTADQLKAATSSVIAQAASTGQINRDQLVQAVESQTALSREDAAEIADRVQAQFERWRGQASAVVASAKEKAQAGALKAAEVSAKAMWGLFLALLLGLIAAVGGGLVGAGPWITARRPRPTREPVREPPYGGHKVVT
jgi:hypothetical protein